MVMAVCGLFILAGGCIYFGAVWAEFGVEWEVVRMEQ
jgi:hypothetical protein